MEAGLDPAGVMKAVPGPVVQIDEGRIQAHLDEVVRATVEETLNGLLDAAGTGKSGACHLFRHTMATLMLEGGADIRFIQQMLGHSRLDSTQIYTHVSIRMLKQIHSATHPAAQLKRGSEAPEEAVENTMLAQDVPGQMWPGVPASTAEQLFAALDAESAEEEQE